MVRETIVEFALEEIVEERDNGAGVGVEETLRELVVPVLFVVAKGVDRPQGPGLLVRQAKVLEAEIHAFLEPDGLAETRIEYSDAALNQGRLQEHLEGVLEMEQDGRHTSVVIVRVERGRRPP